MLVKYLSLRIQDEYQLQRSIGNGSFGQVYLVLHKEDRDTCPWMVDMVGLGWAWRMLAGSELVEVIADCWADFVVSSLILLNLNLGLVNSMVEFRRYSGRRVCI